MNKYDIFVWFLMAIFAGIALLMYFALRKSPNPLPSPYDDTDTTDYSRAAFTSDFPGYDAFLKKMTRIPLTIQGLTALNSFHKSFHDMVPKFSGVKIADVYLKSLIDVQQYARMVIETIGSGEIPHLHDQIFEQLKAANGYANNFRGQTLNVHPNALIGTPFADLLDTVVPLTIPSNVRFEHTWICSGSGGGKRTLLKR